MGAPPFFASTENTKIEAEDNSLHDSPGRHFALKRAVDLPYYGSIMKNIDSTILQGLIVQIPISTPIIIWIPIKSQLQNYC